MMMKYPQKVFYYAPNTDILCMYLYVTDPTNQFLSKLFTKEKVHTHNSYKSTKGLSSPAYILPPQSPMLIDQVSI